jgi:tRNA nucleotidyltransferase (CCA-adding enzyme)
LHNICFNFARTEFDITNKEIVKVMSVNKPEASPFTHDRIATAMATSRSGWEHFPHDADIGVRGFGPTAAEAFEQAARALTAAITDAPVVSRTSVEVRCEAPDIELLFVDWLNAIIYEMAVRHFLFGEFAVRIDGGRLEGRLSGEPVDVERHAPACEPKGATYTELKVGKLQDGGWSAACIIDV